jgi:hypothetical protein
MNRNLVGDEYIIFFGSSVFLKLGPAIRTLDKSSSVKLPLDHMDRDIKKVGREDYGDSEGVAVLEEGQEVCCSGLRHVLTRLEGHRSVFLGSLLPRHVPTKKNGSKAVLEVEAENHAEGGSEDDCEGQIGHDLTEGAFHNYSQISLN